MRLSFHGLGEWTRDRFLVIVAAALLGLFAGIWIFVGIKLLTFTPTTAHPTVQFSTAIATTAGFLAATVATVTASVLGIEVQKVQQSSNAQSLGSSTQTAFRTSRWLLAGFLTYLIVGLFVLVVWLARSEQAADMIETFALGVLGWLAGGFTALFRTAT